MKLTYFGAYGRAEPIRMLFDHAGVKYENNMIGFPELASLKETGYLEFGQVPILEWKDGTVMSQSNAILRACGIEFGYYPLGDMEKMWICDSTLDALYDVFGPCAQTVFAPTNEAKAAALKTFVETILPPFLQRMDARLAGKLYFTGKLSIADFAVGSFLSATAYNSQFPH